MASQMNHRGKADLYNQLAALEHAGVTPERAFRTLAQEAPPRDRKALEVAAALAGQGRSLCVIGARTGLLDRVDREILSAAAVGGRVEQAYRRLAEHHGKADLRQRRVRGRLLLPALVFIVAAFVRPFPAFFVGELALLGYLRASLGLILLVALAVVVAPRLWRLIRSSGLGRSLHWLVLQVPLLRRLETLRSRAIYLDALALLMASGVPALKALRVSADMVPNRQARAALNHVRAAVEAGKPLALAFEACPWMDARSTRLLAAGEVSGALDDMLARIAELTRADLEALEELLATWLPRIAYLLVAAWILSGISPTAFAPKLPVDL
ncbi:type II secretion system F family protein [Thiocystis violacea]|uniref:type II secretion system F family protein n=1 Tax=Thiocystis violacea TaxID=13725 RepID=UPI001908CDFD|nr:type II secretion system F family protein [Thiocystis violacea]MBK1723969.1 hypothetical protein [Thiocystis violacea]